MSNNWTNEQLNAINARGNVLVSASAGSGKTSVMIERIMQIILNGEAEVGEILATTFTHLAAEQIKEKLAKAIKKELPQKPELKKQLDSIAYANITTIHSFCGNLIKSYFYYLDIDASYKILEGVNQADLQQKAISNVFNKLFEEKNKDFLFIVEKYMYKRKSEELKKLVFSIYNFIINEVDPEKFLNDSLNLYTEKGIEKITKIIEEDLNVTLGEIYSCLNELEKNCLEYSTLTSQIISLKNFVESVAEKPLSKMNSACLDYAFPRSPNSKSEDKVYVQYLSLINRCKKALKDIYADILNYYSLATAEKSNYLLLYEDFKKLSFLVLEYKREYDLLKQEAGCLDFNDLEHLAIKLLQNDEIAQDIKSKFKFIFVDEYQDVNSAQEYIIKRLENNNLFLVGDIKQSIYNFRGCNSNLFLKTQSDFHENNQGKNLYLNKNFRSAKNVITSVNNIFSTILTSKGGYDYKNSPMIYGEGYQDFIGDSKILLCNFEKIKQEKQTPTSVYQISDYVSLEEDASSESEGKAIAELINSIIGNKYYNSKKGSFDTISLSDIVILSRSIASDNTQYIIKELQNAGIRVCVENKTEKISYPEIDMLTNLLKLISSHGTIDTAVITGLKWIGNLTDEELVKIRKETPSRNVSFYNAVELYKKQDITSEKIQKYKAILSSLILRSEIADASEVISELISQTNLEAKLGVQYYGEDKVKRLYKFMQLANGYSIDEYIEALSQDKFVFSAPYSQGDAVKVMTIHASKGLEFPIVILCGCGNKFNTKDVEKEFIFDRTLGISLKYRDLANKTIYSSNLLRAYFKKKVIKDLIQEEIRLLYVALTRAEYHLFVTGNCKELQTSIMPFEIEKAKCFMDLIKMGDLSENVITNTSINNFTQTNREIIIQDYDKALAEKIISQLNFSYPLKELIPLKTSVTSTLNDEPIVYDEAVEYEYSDSSAEKGTAYHKFLEIWNFNENYLDFYNNQAKQLLGVDYNFLEKEKLEKICSMEVFSKVKNCSLYKEKQFFVGVPYKLIADSASTKEVLVQGTIDLLALSENKAIIIDYKYSSIAKDEDLIKKYKKQLALYSYAVKKLLNVDTECYLININSQKIIALKEEDLVL